MQEKSSKDEVQSILKVGKENFSPRLIKTSSQHTSGPPIVHIFSYS